VLGVFPCPTLGFGTLGVLELPPPEPPFKPVEVVESPSTLPPPPPPVEVIVVNSEPEIEELLPLVALSN